MTGNMQDVLICHNTLEENCTPELLRGTLHQRTVPRVELEWISEGGVKSSAITIETSLVAGEEALHFFQQYFDIEVSPGQCILFSSEDSETGFILENAQEWLESFRVFRASQIPRRSNRHLVQCSFSNEKLSTIFDILALPGADDYWKQIRITYHDTARTSHEYYMLDITFSNLYQGALDIFNSLKPKLSVLDQHILVSFLFDITREYMNYIENASSSLNLLRSESGHITDTSIRRKSLQNALENYFEFNIGDAVGDAFNVLFIQKLFFLTNTDKTIAANLPEIATRFQQKTFMKKKRESIAKRTMKFEASHSPLNFVNLTALQKHPADFDKDEETSFQKSNMKVDKNRDCGCSIF